MSENKFEYLLFIDQEKLPAKLLLYIKNEFGIAPSEITNRIKSHECAIKVEIHEYNKHYRLIKLIDMLQEQQIPYHVLNEECQPEDRQLLLNMLITFKSSVRELGTEYLHEDEEWWQETPDTYPDED